MAIMVGNGCNSGSLSPLAPTGIIVTGLMERIGLPGHRDADLAYNLLAHAIVGFGGYLIFGGCSCSRARIASKSKRSPRRTSIGTRLLTLGMIARADPRRDLRRLQHRMAAFAGAVLLSLLRAADDGEAIKRMPWGTILMVCGVTVLIGLLEKTGGMEIFRICSRASRHRRP